MALSKYQILYFTSSFQFFRFSHSSFAVAEHSPRNLPVGQLTLLHTNCSNNCDFWLSSSSLSSTSPSFAHLFRIDFTGTIFVHGSLDREKLESEWIELEAGFTHCPPLFAPTTKPPTFSSTAASFGPQRALVRIHLEDINDHSPQFDGEEEGSMLLLSDSMRKGQLLRRSIRAGCFFFH